jgi:uncharacterized membrane protein YdjX (TVP38/TMEM64 family)
MKLKGAVISTIIVILIAAALFVFGLFAPISGALEKALIWISGKGNLAPVFFCLIYFFGTLFLFIPVSIFNLGAGILFGVLQGTVLVSISATSSAVAAFLFGRYLSHDWVEKEIRKHPKFKAIECTISKEDWKVVLATRLTPLFPFSILNYSFGLTQISLKSYLFATWLGMLPGIVMYAYLGSFIGDLSSLNEPRPRSSLELKMYILGCIMSICVAFYLTRLALRALNPKASDPCL